MRAVRNSAGGKFFLNGTSVTNKLILVNAAVYIFSMLMIFAIDENVFLSNIALTPSLIAS